MYFMAWAITHHFIDSTFHFTQNLHYNLSKDIGFCIYLII